MNWMKLGASVAALSLMGASFAEARISSACATQSEVSAIQVSAVVQELTDAALSCGPEAMSDMQRFQVMFQKELRRSDATLKAMFKRLNGARAGDAAYDAYKTRAINHAEQRRIKPDQKVAGVFGRQRGCLDRWRFESECRHDQTQYHHNSHKSFTHK